MKGIRFPLRFSAQDIIDSLRKQQELMDKMRKKDYIDVEFRVVEDAPELPAPSGQAIESKGESQ